MEQTQYWGGKIWSKAKKNKKTNMTCTQLILPSHMEDKRNFVSMRNKGSHHGRKADIQWTLSIKGGGSDPFHKFWGAYT